MKICHVITRMIIGGAQENTLYTLRGHIENGHDAVLVHGKTIGPEGNLLEKIKIPKLRTVYIDHLRREISPLHDFLAFRDLKQFFINEKFDVVHTHSSKAGVIARIAANRAKVPLIVHTVHGPSFHQYQQFWKNWLYIFTERMASKFGDCSFAVAKAMADQYIEKKIDSPDRFQTIYSGMELENYLNGKRDEKLLTELGLDPSAPVVGKIARLFELKGFEFLIQAAPKIISSVPNVQFLIVGDGDLRISIEEEIRTLGLSKYFFFTGLIEPMEVHRYMAIMDIVVHLSLREGLPRSIVQALASGKPAIGFSLDGTPEVIQNNITGVLCKARDSTSVAMNVIRLLQHPELAESMGIRGRESVKKTWDWRYMVSEIEQKYKELLLNKGIPVST